MKTDIEQIKRPYHAYAGYFIEQDEKRRRRYEARFWLVNGCCPECRAPLSFGMQKLGLIERLLGFFNFDMEARCRCGTRVLNRGNHHDWTTYEVFPSSGEPYSESIDF